jgi:hypothetical protein
MLYKHIVRHPGNLTLVCQLVDPDLVFDLHRLQKQKNVVLFLGCECSQEILNDLICGLLIVLYAGC